MYLLWLLSFLKGRLRSRIRVVEGFAFFEMLSKGFRCTWNLSAVSSWAVWREHYAWTFGASERGGSRIRVLRSPVGFSSCSLFPSDPSQVWPAYPWQRCWFGDGQWQDCVVKTWISSDQLCPAQVRLKLYSSTKLKNIYRFLLLAQRPFYLKQMRAYPCLQISLFLNFMLINELSEFNEMNLFLTMESILHSSKK